MSLLGPKTPVVRGRFAVVLALVVAALSAGALAAEASAATPGLRATFSIHFPKGHPASNAPCPDDAFCGVGSVAGYGAATITILDESFSEIPDSSCLGVNRIEQVDLLSGAGSLVIESTGTFCRPGSSGDSHASQSSYGFPGLFSFTTTVNGAESTGVFAGATGSGTETMTVAGAAGVWHLAGTLSAA
jgi:hypothetical protein